MKRYYLYVFLSILAPAMVFSQVAEDPIPSPYQTGSYIPGIIGVRDVANPGFPGWIITDYNVWLWSDSFIDKDGNKVNSIDEFPELGSIPIDVDISGYINSLMITYASPQISALGDAQYLFFVSPNYATAKAHIGLGQLVNGTESIDGGAGGFGDLTVAPLFLSWGWDRFDLTGGYMFVAPTGRFATGADDSMGLGYWSHIFQAAAYYYFMDKATALSLIPTYEFHGTTKDVDVKAGARFILEYGISQYLSEKFEITVQGGNNWQVGEDSGDDVYWDTSVKDRYGTFGVGLGFWPKVDKFYTHLKWNTTYGNRDHFKINSLELQLIIIL